MIKPTALLFCFIFLSGFFLFGPEEKPKALDEPTVFADHAEYRGSTLTIREGIPFLKLTGTHLQMGRAYGVLMRRQVVQAAAIVHDLSRTVASLAPWYVQPVARIALVSEARRMFAKLPPRFRDEMTGLSAGSGVPLDDLASLSFFVDIIGAYACTSVIALTGDGILHGRNLDLLPPAFGRLPVVVEYRPEKGRGYLTVGIAGYLPLLTGLNDAGISVSLHSVPMNNKNSAGKESPGYRLRDILETADTIAGVDSSLLTGYQTEQGWVAMVTSGREAKAAAYNIGGKSVRKDELGARTYLWAVNTFTDPAFNSAYLDLAHSASEINATRARRLISPDLAAPHAGKLISLLGDTRTDDDVDGVGMFTINNFATIQSVVIDPAKRSLDFAFAPAYAGWARRYRYDWPTGSITVSQEADSRSLGAEPARITAWIESLLTHPVRTLAAFDPSMQMTTPIEIVILQLLSQVEKGKYISVERLIPALDRLILSRPRLAIGYRLKGEYLVSRKRFAEAVALLNTGLSVAVMNPYDEKVFRTLLARSYSATPGDAVSSSAQAVRALEKRSPDKK